MKTVVLVIVLICIFFCSCQDQQINVIYNPTETSVSMFGKFAEADATDTVGASDMAIVATETQTEPVTVPPTEPDNRLNIPAGRYSECFTIENSNYYMEYWINIPKNAEKGMPLVVFLHGKQEINRMDLLEEYGIVSVTKELYGEDYPFLLLMPCTHKDSWTAYTVPETLKALIEAVCKEYDVDTTRIIITGHSLGSIGTWKMISLYGVFFSAAVPISCGIGESMNYEACAEVPIRAFCGNVGEYEMKYNRAMHVIVSKINEAGGNATIYIQDGANHDDTVTIFYTKELFDWMLAQ